MALDDVGLAVVVAVAVEVVGHAVAVGVDGREAGGALDVCGLGLGLGVVDDPVAVGVDVEVVGQVGGVGAQGIGVARDQAHAGVAVGVIRVVGRVEPVAVGVGAGRRDVGRGALALAVVGDPVAVAVGVVGVGNPVAVEVENHGGGTGEVREVQIAGARVAVDRSARELDDDPVDGVGEVLDPHEAVGEVGVDVDRAVARAADAVARALDAVAEDHGAPEQRVGVAPAEQRDRGLVETVGSVGGGDLPSYVEVGQRETEAEDGLVEGDLEGRALVDARRVVVELDPVAALDAALRHGREARAVGGHAVGDGPPAGRVAAARGVARGDGRAQLARGLRRARGLDDVGDAVVVVVAVGEVVGAVAVLVEALALLHGEGARLGQRPARLAALPGGQVVVAVDEPVQRTPAAQGGRRPEVAVAAVVAGEAPELDPAGRHEVEQRTLVGVGVVVVVELEGTAVVVGEGAGAEGVEGRAVGGSVADEEIAAERQR